MSCFWRHLESDLEHRTELAWRNRKVSREALCGRQALFPLETLLLYDLTIILHWFSIEVQYVTFWIIKWSQDRSLKTLETELKRIEVLNKRYFLTLIFDHYLFFTFRSKSIGFFRNQKSRIYWNTTLKGITVELNYIYFLFLSHREEFDFIKKSVTLTASLLFVCYCCARCTIGKQGIVENKEILFTLLYILSILTLLYWGLSPPAVHSNPTFSQSFAS